MFAETKFTASDAKKLLNGGKVKKTKLISKAGKPFEAYLSLAPDNGSGYVNFAFDFPKTKKEGSK